MYSLPGIILLYWGHQQKEAPMAKLSRLWLLITVILVAIIATGSIIAWSRYHPGRPIEISLPPPTEIHGEIYISGAVSNPGIYNLTADGSIADIIQAAGGITNSAEPNYIELHVPDPGGTNSPQKIDINRAEGWLLEALPGIGEVRAQAIIDYRYHNGQFRHITELTKVEGIGITTYEQIKHLITVTD
jgi:competence protein ComEA